MTRRRAIASCPDDKNESRVEAARLVWKCPVKMGRKKLLSFRTSATKLLANVMTTLKVLGILRYRGRRAGKRNTSTSFRAIEIVESRRPLNTNHARRQELNYKSRCLFRIPCKQSPSLITASSFGVPVCQYIPSSGRTRIIQRRWYSSSWNGQDVIV